MVESVMNVRPKAINAGRKPAVRLWPFAAALLTLAVLGTLGFDWYSGKLGIIGPHFEVVQTAAGKIIKVPPGGNVQAAIARAEGGDIVELQAGATYFGEIKLPKKALTDFITIQTSAIPELPADKRIGPEHAPLLAKIVTRDASPALSAANGAHHFRFVGIEFAPASNAYVYNLVVFGNGETAANLPHDLEIDRCYLHTYKSAIARRGIALNSASTTIKNSYFEGFAFNSEETQGIAGWTGTRNVRIINNYIEAGAENVLFGGADPDSADLIPTDIEVRGNHLNKSTDWIKKATCKTLFQLKNAKRVQFVGNLLTNNWEGSAIRLTVRNQENHAAYSTIEDILIKDNMIDKSADGFNILGKDDTYPSQTLKRLTIVNNLFLGIAHGGNFDGAGYFVQIADGEDIVIANNTVFNSGNITSLYGTLPRGFVFRDNIVGHGNYGVHGPIDMRSEAAKAMFNNNVIMNLNRVPSDDYAFPPGNSIVGDVKDVGFQDPAAKNFTLSANSRFRGKSTQRSDIGADLKGSSFSALLSKQ